MDEFFGQWNLSQASQEAFLSLDMSTQNEILESFSPRDTSRDVNGLFMSFVRSRSTGPLPPAPVPEVFEKQAHHEEFFQKWDLQEKAQQALLALPPSTQADVMLKFQPRDTSRDVNPLFLSFVRGSAGFAPNQPQAPIRSPGFVPPQLLAVTHETRNPSLEHLAPATLESVQKFCLMWNLNEESVEFFESLTPQTQTDIIEKFHPRDTSRDVNRIFLSFARSRACLSGPLKQVQRSGPAGTRPVQVQGGVVMSRADLQCKWNLNFAALKEFDSLPPVVQQRVMVEFNPRDTSRDANSCFISFCKSRAAFIFAEKWKLDPDSIQMFNDLTAEKQQEVLRTFSPRDASRDVNNVFKAFVSSRLNPPPAGANVGSNAVSRKRPLDKLTVFAEEWKLNPQNVELLESLTPDQQAQVLTKFSPRDTSRDCNALFAKFAMSMAN